MKPSNQWVKTNTYYLRLLVDDWAGSESYFYKCGTRKFSGPTDRSRLDNLKFWDYYEGRECRSTLVPLRNGLYAEIEFHDAMFPVEQWHLWEKALENLLQTMTPTH
jgi:hypothetical protein